MKKIKLSTIPLQVQKSVARFPGAMLFCTLFFIVTVCAIHDSNGLFDNNIYRCCMALSLGFALAMSVRIATDYNSAHGRLRFLDSLTIPLMLLYFFLLPHDKDFSDTDGIRFVVFCIIALLLLCLASGEKAKHAVAFWHYNVKLWTQALLAFIFASIFFGGFALAIFAVDTLFDVNINDKWYGYLATFFYSIFAPLYFAAGVPEEKETEEKTQEYSLLRIIGEYVLFPILVTYLIILYVYGLKILFTWELPNGWITWLVMVYSGFSLFTYFLLNKWHVTNNSKLSVLFGKYFFFSELPLLILLFIAIFRRISDYGLTENRFFIMMAAFWLLGIALYMIFSKGKNLRVLFISFAILAFLCVMGPWSAFSLSRKAQLHRLEKLLSRHELLVNGKVPAASDTIKTLSEADYEAIRDGVRYFAKERLQDLQPLFTANIDSLKEEYGSWNLSKYLLPYVMVAGDEQKDHSESFSVLTPRDADMIDIRGYDLLFCYEYDHWMEDAVLGDTASDYYIKIQDGGQMQIYRHGVLSDSISISEVFRNIFSIAELQSMQYNAVVSQEKLTVSGKNYQLLFTKVRGEYTSDSLSVTTANIYILLKK